MIIVITLGLTTAAALQRSREWLRTVGSTLLLWIPCLIVTAAAPTLFGFGVFLAGGGSSGLLGVVLGLLGVSLLEAAALSFWGPAVIRRLLER
jgi:hypothetical protein